MVVMTIGIDTLALTCLVLITLISVILAIKAALVNKVRDNKNNRTRVFCRFCRQDFSLDKGSDSQAEAITSKITINTAPCPNCGKLQWRGSSRNLL